MLLLQDWQQLWQQLRQTPSSAGVMLSWTSLNQIKTEITRQRQMAQQQQQMLLQAAEASQSSQHLVSGLSVGSRAAAYGQDRQACKQRMQQETNP
jgi:hypothetical protein